MVNLDELEELLRSGKDEEAYKQIKEDRGITAEILMNEGITFGTLGDYSISISYFELAEKIAEDDKIIERVRVNLAVSYYNRGNAYGKLKKHEKAIEDYNKAIALDPEYAVAYNNRGTAYDELKKHEKAIEDYNKAIALNPEYATAYANRGITRLLSNEELYKAIADFKSARNFF
jgi:tetratricopeptide (TPR) repeat protein